MKEAGAVSKNTLLSWRLLHRFAVPQIQMKKTKCCMITLEEATPMPQGLLTPQSLEYLLQVTREVNGYQERMYAWMTAQKTLVAQKVAAWTICCWSHPSGSLAVQFNTGVDHATGDWAPGRCTKGICYLNFISRELYRSESWKKIRSGCRATQTTGEVKKGQWGAPRSIWTANYGPAATDDG
jgi:hypothetical protein